MYKGCIFHISNANVIEKMVFFTITTTFILEFETRAPNGSGNVNNGVK